MDATIDELLAVARAGIPRLTPREARAAAGAGAILVDIRPEAQRRRDGLVPGAAVVDRNVLEWRLDPRSEHRDPRLARRDRPVILICDDGYQTSLAAALLRRLGIDAGEVIGGVRAWKASGLALHRDGARRISRPGPRRTARSRRPRRPPDPYPRNVPRPPSFG